MQNLIRRHIVASDLGLHCLPTSLSRFPGKNGLMVNRKQPYHSLNCLFFLWELGGQNLSEKICSL